MEISQISNLTNEKYDHIKIEVEKLPTEIVIEMFKFLNLSTISKIFLTCRRLYELANDEVMWKFRCKSILSLDIRYKPPSMSFKEYFKESYEWQDWTFCLDKHERYLEPSEDRKCCEQTRHSYSIALTTEELKPNFVSKLKIRLEKPNENSFRFSVGIMRDPRKIPKAADSFYIIPGLVLTNLDMYEPFFFMLNETHVNCHLVGYDNTDPNTIVTLLDRRLKKVEEFSLVCDRKNGTLQITVGKDVCPVIKNKEICEGEWFFGIFSGLSQGVKWKILPRFEVLYEKTDV